MNMDGDEDLDKKIEEWLQWDKVITHCACQAAPMMKTWKPESY